MTSLHPPSFHRNDFPTCSTHFFNYGAKHQPFFAPRAILYTHACARGQRPAPAPAGPSMHARVQSHVMASFSVSPWRAPRSTIGIYGERKTIAWCPCIPPSTVERFGEKISAEACSGKEIAGLLKKMMMMMNMMTRKSRNCI